MEQIKSSLVRIYSNSTEFIIGCGFMVKPQLILTCAHVVKDALNLKSYNTIPKRNIVMDFPFVDGSPKVNGKVLKWFPPKKLTQNDIALIEIVNPVPEGAIFSQLSLPQKLESRAISTLGFTNDYPFGQNATGTLMGTVAGGHVQVVAHSELGYFIEQGFSGTPVWDKWDGGIIGMVASVDQNQSTRAAFIVPSKMIIQNLPDLIVSQNDPVSIGQKHLFSTGHIYISYHDSEIELALQLASDLKNAGISVWLDRIDSPGVGHDWRQVLQNAMNEAVAIISCISPAYLQSKYCRSELARAEDLNLQIFPLMLQAIPENEKPFEIQRIQSLLFQDWHQRDIYLAYLRELIDSLKKLFPNQFGILPEASIRYVTSLIARLEKHQGVLSYVNLFAQSNQPDYENYRNDYRLQFSQEFAVLDLPESNDKLKITTTDILEVSRQYDRFILLGEPGSGKSTILRRFAVDNGHAFLKNPIKSPQPLYLRLSDWVDEASPEAFVRNQWRKLDLSRLDPVELLTRGEIELFLDGFDEIKGNALDKQILLHDWLTGAQAPKKVVVTCRTDRYQEEVNLRFPSIYLESLSDNHIKQFVNVYLKEDATGFINRIFSGESSHQDSSLFKLAQNPYLLSALIIIYQHSPDKKLPKNNGTLFQSLVRVLWERERLKHTDGWVPLIQMENAFSKLAFHMLDKNLPVDIPRSIALEYVGDIKLLRAGHNASLLLIEGDTVRFYHQFIHDYFAAIELERLGISAKLKTPIIHNKQRLGDLWDQPLIALCGISNSTQTLLQEIADKDPFLAVLCIESGLDVVPETWQILVKKLIAVFDITVKFNFDAFLQSDDIVEYRQALVVATVLRLGQLVTPYLIQEFEDPSQNAFVKLAVIDLLAQLEDERSIPTLGKFIENSVAENDARKLAEKQLARVIVTLGLSTSIGVLLTTLGPIHTRKSSPLIAQFGGAVKKAIGTYSQQDAEWFSLRVAAIRALGISKSPESIPYLVSGLTNADNSVRKACVEVLDSVQWEAATNQEKAAYYIALEDWNSCAALKEDAVPLLQKIILNDDFNFNTQANAIRTIGKIGQESSTLMIYSAFRQTDNVEVRLACLDAFSSFANDISILGLLTIVQDRDAFMRDKAKLILSNMNENNLLSGVQFSLTDDIQGLLKTDNSSMRDRLRNLHYDEIKTVQLEAINLLRQINKLAKQRILVKLLSRKERHLIIASLELLSSFSENPDLVANIVPLFEHPKQDVQIAAIQSLGTMQANMAVPSLEKLLFKSMENRHRFSKLTDKLAKKGLVGQTISQEILNALKQINSTEARQVLLNWESRRH